MIQSLLLTKNLWVFLERGIIKTKISNQTKSSLATIPKLSANQIRKRANSLVCNFFLLLAHNKYLAKRNETRCIKSTRKKALKIVQKVFRETNAGYETWWRWACVCLAVFVPFAFVCVSVCGTNCDASTGDTIPWYHLVHFGCRRCSSDSPPEIPCWTCTWTRALIV